jgi:predicted glycogen debranching enzyme
MNDTVIRSIPNGGADAADPESLGSREWLVTNGLGGYASGTVSGVLSRRYHGILIAALRAPFGRTVMLNRVFERVRLPGGRTVSLSSQEKADAAPIVDECGCLREFRLEAGLPVWCFETDGMVLERRILLPHMQNTVHITYRLLQGAGPVEFELYPGLHFRGHDAAVSETLSQSYTVSARGTLYEVSDGSALPPLRLKLHGDGGALTLDQGQVTDLLFRAEEKRGYDHVGRLWCPGFFRVLVSTESSATLVASTESWETILALHPEEALAVETRRRVLLLSAADARARQGVGAELVLAADQFLITPAGRAEDAARARAAGDEVRTVIAGYHWFTDWGRDTMISLEGLALVTGRLAEAGWILRTFAHYVRDGLIPNMFPEGENQGLYHTADATLWFFHALDRYLEATGDVPTLNLILPKLVDIVEHHVHGTRFGIRVDPADGLLTQGEPGYQLTWMDAKVGDWVVTPRRGKTVEINALWYNSLRLLEGWLRVHRSAAAALPVSELAGRAARSFNGRFWYERGGWLYDVVDGEHGNDSACRPNQLLSFSLRHPVLDSTRWAGVLDVVSSKLLTPAGLRSLAPGDPDYKPTYDGDLRTRDAAYHQGTVWGWLAGPFVDAWLRVHPGDYANARGILEGFVPHLNEACIGSLSEIFDAEAPYTPRGCVAQAWTVAEVLRAWVKTAG